MKKNILLWIVAFVLTLAVAVYQRVTGPTYPISGKVEFAGEEIKYKLLRTHEGTTSHKVEIEVKNPEVSAELVWKRFKSHDDWTISEMERNENKLSASFPGQPAAGIIIYFINLHDGKSSKIIPEDKDVVLRFKGAVPIAILIIHVIAMFGAMLLSTRTGLEIFNSGNTYLKLTYWTIGFLFIGGLILGPIVQKYAFDAFWTGFPFGYDLTDNKTGIALIGWVIALFAFKKSKNPRRIALIAALILIVVYLIPHSVLGSEIDYTKLENSKALIEKNINE